MFSYSSCYMRLNPTGKVFNEKTNNLIEYPTSMIASMMYQITISKYSPENRDALNAHDTTTVVLANKKAPRLEGGHSTKNIGMWNLKQKMSSPKFYELLIKAELKGDTDLDQKNFHNHIDMCINAMNRLL